MTNQEIFRANDVRGIYGKDITGKTADLIGKSFGSFIGEGSRIAVGRDTRKGGEVLKKHLIDSLVSVGCDVIDVGMVTTPMLYFSVANYGLDGGVNVTASHNPSEWNGFKMAKKMGELCSQGKGIEEVRKRFLEENFAETSKKRNVTQKDIRKDYANFLLSKIKVPKKMKIILDPGNGAACGISESLFSEAGYDVIIINGEPDGSFPNRPSDTIEGNVRKLMREVIEKKADMGIAFDGDADRLSFIDNKGRYVQSGNVTIPLFSEYYLKKEKGGKIVYDICCSSFVEESVKKNGGIPLSIRVGHSFIMNKMIEEKAVFGGEYSNHLYFSEIFCFDDAIFAGLKMAEIVGSSGRIFSDIVDDIPKYPSSRVEEIECSDLTKFDIVKKIGERLRSEGFRILDIDGIKAFNEDGSWMLIRGSNTAPVIKINTEAKTKEKMEEMFKYAKEAVLEEVGK